MHVYHDVYTVREAVFISWDDAELTWVGHVHVNPLSARQVRAATAVGSAQDEHNDFISSYCLGLSVLIQSNQVWTFAFAFEAAVCVVLSTSAIAPGKLQLKKKQ